MVISTALIGKRLKSAFENESYATAEQEAN